MQDFGTVELHDPFRQFQASDNERNLEKKKKRILNVKIMMEMY